MERAVTLSWPGRVTSTPTRLSKAKAPRIAYEAPDGASRLIRGDNAIELARLAKAQPESATLVYMDPPFLTNRAHDALLLKAGARRGTADARRRELAFDDRWSDRASYLEALESRLRAARELLAPWGSLVVHVDPKTSHYVKVLADEIFGEEAFASEIVWRYRRWPTKTPNFQRVHDVLLRYRKDPNEKPRWNAMYEPLAPSTLATWGTAKQRAHFDAEGRRRRSTATEETTQGVPLGDVWDIGVIAPIAKERTGYPSQKPEALLERLISALTAPGDLVVDPYAGSGTTLAVAARLDRRFLGIDESDVAIDVACQRLRALMEPAVARTSARALPSKSHA
jgi:DNA modification methylase